MISILKEFFGFGGYTREAEGYFSAEHLLFVSLLMLIMISSAVFIGVKNRKKDVKIKNKVLIVSAILIDSFELFKIIITCIRSQDPLAWRYDLPLFLCSIQLITIPIAAFSRSKLKNAALDFVFIFGILGAVMGTYCAGNNYGTYPVLSFDNVVSGITHSISGFTSLYIVISGMASMKKENVTSTFAILLSFCVCAFSVNKIIDYNYMFLVRGDGTPYEILFNLVNGNQILYPLLVVALFLAYIVLFYFVYYLISKRKGSKKCTQTEN